MTTKDDCIIWPGCVTRAGYGRIGSKYAHRFVWELVNGPIPDGREVMHACDVPRCVNPRHLSIGTHLDNMKDRDTKGRSNNELKVKRGSHNGTSKLTEDDVRDIRARAVTRSRYKPVTNASNLTQLAREYGLSHSNVWNIVTRKTWTHI